MEVRLNIHYESVSRTANSARPASEAHPLEKNLALESIGSPEAPFQAELEQVPEVRADVVERGRSLVADPEYPPRKTLEGLSQLLALGFRTVAPNR